jgi:hypothetical protein
MRVKLQNTNVGTGMPIAAKCPGCGSIGAFELIENVHDVHVMPDLWLGQRKCPIRACSTHLFVVYRSDGKGDRTYPAPTIDFNPQGIPAPIVKSFSEALTCQAQGLHVAAAIMIRRTLEELCQDKNASGANLKDRINALQSSVVLPKELFDALDDLRLLGNDAAHIEAKTYDTIGNDEVEVGIELTKEVLKAVYQLDGLLSRLRALKKP